jgi:hypothetical protein
MYLYLINLKDDLGFERIENIKVVIQIISIEAIFEMSLEQFSTLDIDLTVTVTNCMLRQVTEARLVFIGEGERN